MEELEKRKERLRLIRMQSAKSELDSQNSLNPTGHLVNPLVQCNSGSPAHESPASYHRFDYYTDPMSAFSGGKKRGNAASDNIPSSYGSSSGAHLPSPFSGSRNTNMTSFPAPANQFQVNSSPYQGLHRMQSPILQSVSPGTTGSFSTDSPQGAPSSMQYRSPSPSGFGSPQQMPRGGFLSPRGRGSPHSNSGRGNQSMNSGRGGYNPRFTNTPGPYRYGSNSGYSELRNSSSSSGWNSGWKKGAGESASALQNPEIFYSKIMIQDPWEGSSPVVGSIMAIMAPQKTPGSSSSSWLPSSIATKKAKVGEVGKSFQSRSSLAEYLTLSFEEAAKDDSEI